MKLLKQGILIAVEGVDGSGKSTLAHNLFNFYSGKYTTLLTKEPGGSKLGFFLRSHLQEQQISICSEAEFLLFAADRAQHFHEYVIPALTNNTLIISDRLADSSLVYQGYGRGLSLSMIETINNWVMKSIKPTITIYVNVSFETAIHRLLSRNQTLTRFEKNQDFFKKIIGGFNDLYKNRTDVVIVDGEQTQEQVMIEVVQKIDPLITKYVENYAPF